MGPNSNTRECFTCFRSSTKQFSKLVNYSVKNQWHSLFFWNWACFFLQVEYWPLNNELHDSILIITRKNVRLEYLKVDRMQLNLENECENLKSPMK